MCLQTEKGVSLWGYCFLLAGYQVGCSTLASRSWPRKGGGMLLSGEFLHIMTSWLRDNDAVPPYPPTKNAIAYYYLCPGLFVFCLFCLSVSWSKNTDVNEVWQIVRLWAKEDVMIFGCRRCHNCSQVYEPKQISSHCLVQRASLFFFGHKML